MPHVVRAFLWEEQRERGVEEVADLVKRARSDGTQEGFQFRKGELDRIEVRTVGRQEAQPRTGAFDRQPDLGLFVDDEVVEHHDVARTQRRRQDLFHIREKADGIDRAVEHGRGGQRRRPERGHHGVRLPVPARRVIDGAGPAWTPRIASEQIGGDPRFVDEHVGPCVVQRLGGAPAAPFSGDVRPALFGGVYRFF